MNEWIANTKNKIPPARATCLSEMLEASILPPTTASPVQSACPIVPPIVTPNGSFDDAKAIVAICERSPHSMP